MSAPTRVVPPADPRFYVIALNHLGLDRRFPEGQQRQVPAAGLEEVECYPRHQSDIQAALQHQPAVCRAQESAAVGGVKALPK